MFKFIMSYTYNNKQKNYVSVKIMFQISLLSFFVCRLEKKEGFDEKSQYKNYLKLYKNKN